jgi:peptidoglycan hydrolase-like protein with peptidoglycan-binding domain
VDHFPLRAHRRALLLLVAIVAAIPVVLGAATGARAATRADPGGATAGSGSSTGSTTQATGDGEDQPAGSGATRTLRRGMHGPDVRALQRALGKLGFRVTADGAYGVRTLRGVKRYERRQGLVPDGVVDPDEGRQIAQAAGIPAGASSSADTTTTDASAGTSGGPQATLNPDGTASAPAGAPQAVAQIVAAGNQIADLPYVYGGGHTDDFQDSGYDCSGSVSFALHGAGLLSAPLDSGEFMSWGDEGPGQWVTIYANEGHMYMVVAGLRFDTSGASASGSRWQTEGRSSSGYVVRHPPGL